MKRSCIFQIVSICLLIFGVKCGDQDTLVQSLMDISGAPLEYDESGATKFLNVASVCMQCAYEKEQNIIKIETLVNKIMTEKPRTELIVFGETILGRYYGLENPEVYQRQVAESIPGPATDFVGALADSHNVYIVFGMSELDNGVLYNSLVLLNPEGEIEDVQRKYHLINTDEDAGFAVGTKKTVVTINGIKTGLIICADVSSYEVTKALVDENIDLVIHSLASVAKEFTIDAVARQFNAWVVFANRYGQEGEDFCPGTCYISDPAGTIRVGGEGGERYEYYRIGVY